jgi:hypothetical protein
MSYRNGDKSRENRLRKAREKKRIAVQQLKTKAAASKAEAAKK